MTQIYNNFYRIEIAGSSGHVFVWISYDTIIGFQVNDGEKVCSENNWSTTTGKHLNYIQLGRHGRLQRDVFEQRLEAALVDFIV